MMSSWHGLGLGLRGLSLSHRNLSGIGNPLPAGAYRPMGTHWLVSTTTMVNTDNYLCGAHVVGEPLTESVGQDLPLHP